MTCPREGLSRRGMSGRKFLMKYANSANGLCQLFGIGALSEYYKCIFLFYLLLVFACFSTTISYLW